MIYGETAIYGVLTNQVFFMSQHYANLIIMADHGDVFQCLVFCGVAVVGGHRSDRWSYSENINDTMPTCSDTGLTPHPSRHMVLM